MQTQCFFKNYTIEFLVNRPSVVFETRLLAAKLSLPEAKAIKYEK